MDPHAAATVVHGAAVLITCTFVGRSGLTIVHMRRAGFHSTLIGSWATIAVFGLFVSVLGAGLGAYAMMQIVPPDITWPVQMAAQIVGGLLVSYLASVWYHRQIANVLWRWLSAEGGTNSDA